MKNLNLTFYAFAGISSMPVTLLAGQFQPEKKSIDKQHPNVVLIVADDLGYGDLSCYGADAIQTPGMDRIANEGIRFTQGFCTAATSTPSRYSVMTGRYPWTNPDAKILPGNAKLIIDTEAITLPKVMKQAGYITGSVGKWHIGLGMVMWTGIKEYIRELLRLDMIIRLFRQLRMIGCLAFFRE